MAYLQKITIAGICLLAGAGVYGQSPKEKAAQLAGQAVHLMDNGDPGQAISLLEEAIRIDSARYAYGYEIGYAHYIQQAYSKAAKQFERMVLHPHVDARGFQMLGNAYDMSGKPQKAIEAYQRGLQRFPNSGLLHMEIGTVHLLQKQEDLAAQWYEQGIERDPSFPSSYFRVAMLYFNSSEVVWGMLYGELFANLERGTQRSIDMNTILYKAYKENLTVKDGTAAASFAKEKTRTNTASATPSLPYGQAVYEPKIRQSAEGERSIDFASLHRIRSKFIERYYADSLDKKIPNPLFAYHKQLIDNGHFEAYNAYLFAAGDNTAFRNWKLRNLDAWDAFVAWYKANPLIMNTETAFGRARTEEYTAKAFLEKQ